MAEKKKLTFMALVRDSGWWVIGEITRRALAEQGFEVEVAWAPREQRIARVASGEVDLAANAQYEVIWMYHGIGQYEGKPITDLRAIAAVIQPCWVAFGVRYETYLTSIEQIKERKFPLRIYTPHARFGGKLSSQGFIADKIFEAYGFSLQDIESWGGKAWHAENGGQVAIREGNFDAIMYRATPGYGPGGKRWQEATIPHNMRFLPIAPSILDMMVKNYRMTRGTMPRLLMRGVDESMPALYFPYRLIYTSKHMDEGLAFTIAKTLDERAEYFFETHYPTSYNPNLAWRAGIPLNPGAERYYRERGYMK